MTPVFAVQVTNRDDTEIALTVEALNKLGYEWIDFGLIPFTKEITNLEAFPTDRMVIPLAGTKLLTLGAEGMLPRNWEIWYENSLMDQYYARGILKDHMLNADSELYEYHEVAEKTFKEDRFIKPTSDGKAFAGVVIPAGTSLRQHLETVTHQPIDVDENVLVARIRNIDREFRCFVVDDQVVGVSEYKSARGIKAKVVEPSMVRGLEIYVHNLPASIPLACVDVCEVLGDDGVVKCWKIVEINCFHCCGMYKVDRAAVFEALMKAISEKRI
jgi:hypothetical protein